MDTSLTHGTSHVSYILRREYYGTRMKQGSVYKVWERKAMIAGFWWEHCTEGATCKMLT